MRDLSLLRWNWLGRGLSLLLIVFIGLFSFIAPFSAMAEPLQSPGPHQEVMAPSEESLSQAESSVTGVVLSLKEKPLPPELAAAEKPPGMSPLATGERVQEVRVKITSGELKGKIVQVDNVQGENPIYNIPLEVGARVLLYVEKTPDGRHKVYISNRDRMPALMLLFGTLLLALLVVGGRQTFKYLVLVSVSLVLLTRSMIPPMLAGEPGSLMSMVLTLLVATLGGMLLLPNDRQTPRFMLLLILATLVNVTLLLLIIFIVSILAPLYGFFSESMATLWYQYPKLDFQQMLFASAVVSHVGLLFFITLSILQVCWKTAMPEPLLEPSLKIPFRDVYRAGLRHGQGLLGPILLGVTLLYAGLYFPNLLQGAQTALFDTLNLEAYASYTAMVLSGALAMVLAVPATAALGGWLLRREPSVPALE